VMTKAIGVVGTAKNTGKTTTLVALVRAIHERGDKTVAVTSIGYDGELVDSLTFLPKPRIELPVGALVATAERCLENARLKGDVLGRTGIETPLGEVLLLRVTTTGRIVVAGPNQRTGLETVRRALAEAGANWILVDGALGRMAPMSAVDGIVISTGAARTTDLNQLAEETKALHAVLSLPQFTDIGPEFPSQPTNIMICGRDNRWIDTGIATLLDPDQAIMVLEQMPAESRAIVFPGLVMTPALQFMQQQLQEHLSEMHFTATNPLVLLLGGEPANVHSTLKAILEQDAGIGVLQPLPLLAVTINPFYPRRHRAGAFASAYIDKDALREKISAAVPIPVVDVVTDGAKPVLSAIELS